ncbi:hypothetical protein AB4Y43_07060 [Paraburkholderia sp. BR10872]|uniref:hypothetical protein n=1 Tax=Paraburkholderia sp. BR10872 TaxID=3236989 RepID=UPI0034D38DD1
MKQQVYQENEASMTCRYSNTDWLDVLYTSIRGTPGGLPEAAAFLTNRRGRNITTESLRLRLRGQGENRLSMEMFELLIEWMEERRQPQYRDALIALNERFNLSVVPNDIVQVGSTPHDIAMQTFDLAQHAGIVAECVREALEDRIVTPAEADNIIGAARDSKRLLDRIIATVRRVSAKPAR